MNKQSDLQRKGHLPAPIRNVAELGNLVEAVRKGQGLTQLDVSGVTGLGNRFMVDLEKGKQTIQLQKVFNVLAQLGLEVVIRKKGSP
ncbi:transcriptional regulator [Lacisediminimonas sp.]|uniref:transcriptional regulator n=1 Tax=Lacisediminimonas sp. TaxID=3060582 RepID=UPI002720A31C|nr:transcriptional regulator [Lacisediminimonas sp.]MDO8300690.1 transcriptional regulator [Lacisediminimonas sp.]